MQHLLAALLATYVPLCTLELPIGARCVIDKHVWQYRCVVAAPKAFVCDRRLKRPTTKGGIPT